MLPLLTLNKSVLAGRTAARKMSEIVPTCFFNKKTMFFCLSLNLLNPFSVTFTKWSNTLKQFVSNSLTNCLSVFGHFVGLALKELKCMTDCFHISSALRNLVPFVQFKKRDTIYLINKVPELQACTVTPNRIDQRFQFMK